MNGAEKLWRYWYQQGLDFKSTYKGVDCVKNPLDLWVYGEIIHETKPELIVETGTFHGGSALWLADQFDGDVLSIDLESDRALPEHDRVEFIAGASSTDPAVLSVVRRACDGKRTMVILDSDHSREHVLKELELYSPLVSTGCYLIVEDTNPFAYSGPAGPALALKAWQPKNRGFEVDRSRERFVITSHPGGYLKRIR